MRKVRIEQNRFGHLEIDVVGKRLARRIRRQQQEQGASTDDDSAIYVQDEGEADAILGVVPRRKARDVREGWSTVVMLSLDTVYALAGLE
jgi:hypothetical protein